ncbi:porphobilinogen deaminase [Flavobacterium rivuli WB 3.3-2 = DSM 21788]|uniref:Hydroxymethylbilane synthase n=1 Tax=Flavobacterium rivuli WB 3.3-2 = DSM 21788 TaxID=1121895 RepID=A0A0A2LZB5_9FLAO|nr:hydroxymethylbilane synthase [Flavobacterium rivuli]KGO85682.1 porphobilinogen deaminase [Flavobacterium rivuli WB 3.3-2 = DSM 21788]
MSKTIRIGTRDSELALWQAHTVERKLNAMGYHTEIVAVKSTGDLILDVPLYELGITGIFTKTLDVAMLSGTIDIAVHSMKDVPTALPIGIVQAAVLERATVHDILVTKGNANFYTDTATIATGSLRRQAQWLNRYPHHKVVDLRGNVNTRLKKLAESDWNGAVFAEAGLERINLLPEEFTTLDWMIPAPAQGAMVVVTMEKDIFCTEAVAKLNHGPSDVATFIERQFLKRLEGGCTAPIGALVTFIDNEIRLEGVLLSIDGREKLHIEKVLPAGSNYMNFGNECADQILANGGAELMASIKDQLNK